MEVPLFLYISFLLLKNVFLAEPDIGPQPQQAYYEIYDDSYSNRDLNQIAVTEFGVVRNISYVGVAKGWGSTELAQEVTVSLYRTPGSNVNRLISVVQIHDILEVGDPVKVVSINGRVQVSLREEMAKQRK